MPIHKRPHGAGGDGIEQPLAGAGLAENAIHQLLFPRRTRSALMNGYSFTKASSRGFDVSMAIEVYQTSLPSFLAPSTRAD